MINPTITPDPFFTIFPAIDLRDGKVVRLSQGDPFRQTIYGDDPQAWAEKWKSEGADWLHIINLSGAFNEGSESNFEALRKILQVGLKVEFGGGIRNKDMIQNLMDHNIERIFLGTAAIKDSELVDWAISHYGPKRIAGDIGARNGKVMIKGWQETTEVDMIDLGIRFRKQGIEWCVLTDVENDGVNRGVNIESAVELQQTTGLKVVASGGVSSLKDVKDVFASGLSGVIIGRALYDNNFSLNECFMEIK